MEHLFKGRRVRIRASTTDEWCEGKVALISSNGRSAVFLIEGMVRAKGGYIGGGPLPLQIDPIEETVTGLDGMEYEVEVLSYRQELADKMIEVAEKLQTICGSEYDPDAFDRTLQSLAELEELTAGDLHKALMRAIADKPE
jgi:hypothetical protein